MTSATTTDSKSVTIEYQVNQPITAATPLQFGVYRSSDGQFDSSDALVDTDTLVPPGATSGQAGTLDQAGQPATAVGTHELTIALPQGLAPYPEKPDVLVVADPGSPSATTDPQQTASFRVYTIGIVTHGGIQDTSWKNGPPWELQIAYEMKQEGFDAAIPYNWVQQSGTPGEAIKQSPKLARIVLGTADRFPANDPVDLEFIGHSEGAVVNTYAIAKLQGEMTPQLSAGFIEDTLLDPHAANNDIASGKQISVAGPLGGLAHLIITSYQGKANDPPAYFPSVVDEAQVFYQHSPAKASAIYNLWGQVPVKSDGPLVHYYNLTPSGVTHSGNTGIPEWYRNFIVPTLGDQAPLVQQLQLNGQIDGAQPAATPAVTSAGGGALVRQANASRADRAYGPEQVVSTRQPEFSGTAAPRLDGTALPRARDEALGGLVGRHGTCGRRRQLVVDHPQPAPRRAVPYRRLGILGRTHHPARNEDRPHPAAGTPRRRCTARALSGSSPLLRTLHRFPLDRLDHLLEIRPAADRSEVGVGLEGLRVGEPAPDGAAKELDDTVAVLLAAEPIALAQLADVAGALRPVRGADQRDAERHVARQIVAVARIELG